MRSGILRHTIPAAVLKVACAINQDIKALVPRPQSPWSMRFLTYFVQGWQQELLTYWHDQGATVESLRFDIMLRTLVPLPPSGSADAV
jgi:type I restriction enzyme S subunit